ncbi:hypothetical protein TeGR_g171, partial [Tetraparma gracilis]
MLLSYDGNGDGKLDPDELALALTRFQAAAQAYTDYLSPRFRFSSLLSTSVVSFVYRSFGLTLLLIFFVTIIPGLLHSLSGRVLRWPVLAITYLQIGAELSVYVAVRALIHLLEFVFTSSKHRRLRRKIRESGSYAEWLGNC